jgi:hypothetical protein
MSKTNASGWNWSGIGLLVLVNLVATSFLFSSGTGDVSIWDTWMREIYGYGLIGGFAHSGTDYPPLAFVILALIGRCAQAFGTTPLLVLKCSLLLFLFATTGCFYWFSRNLILTAALELSLILNSVALGYLDIYFAPFLIAGFLLLSRQHLNAGLLFYAISCAIKWQPLILAPFVCLYVLNAASERVSGAQSVKKFRITPFVTSALVILVPIFAIFGPSAVFDSLRRAMTYHKFLSGYALNLGWIETWALHLLDPGKYGPLQNGAIDIFIAREPLVVWPDKILFYLSYAAIVFVFTRQRKTFGRLVAYSMLGYLAYFSFNTGVHENHLFLVCCLASILVFLEPEQLVRGINFSLAANANLFLFYGVFGQRLNPVIAGVDITLLFAVANLCLFAGFLLHTLKTDHVGLKFWQANRPRPLDEAN